MSCKAVKTVFNPIDEQSHYPYLETAESPFEKRLGHDQQLTDVSGNNPESILDTMNHITETANFLVEELCDSEGVFHLPPSINEGQITVKTYNSQHIASKPFKVDVKPFESETFTKIGNGVERNVYIDSRKDFVYKVPNYWLSLDTSCINLRSRDCSFDVSPHGTIPNISFVYSDYLEKTALNISRGLQQNYAGIDMADLKRRFDTRVAVTMFLEVPVKSRKVPVLVQEYFSPNEWEECSFPTEIADYICEDFAGIYDLHPANVLRNVHTGEVVLIDCIKHFIRMPVENKKSL